MQETTGLFSFLDEIHSSYIGFGGGVIFFVLFFGINYHYADWFTRIFFGIVLYGFSLGLGVAVDGSVEDRTAAFVAGFWAPLVLFSLATILLRRAFPIQKEDPSNYDHLIDQP